MSAKSPLTPEQRQILLKTLDEMSGDMAATARALDVDPRTVHNIKSSYDRDVPIMDGRYDRFNNNHRSGLRATRRKSFDACADDIMHGHLLFDDEEVEADDL